MTSIRIYYISRYKQFCKYLLHHSRPYSNNRIRFWDMLKHDVPIKRLLLKK
jgi:hypothetical protein